jgi:phytoene/squalene synthetase
MMCWIMGVRSPAALARACELGVAMQLTNIARDVGEDARNGRLYLPRQWLLEAGVDADAWLTNPVCTPALQCVVERLLAETDRLYGQASSGMRCCRATGLRRDWSTAQARWARSAGAACGGGPFAQAGVAGLRERTLGVGGS